MGVRDIKKADFRQYSQVVQTVNCGCQDCPDHFAIQRISFTGNSKFSVNGKNLPVFTGKF
jgi:hypothetical protein